MRLAQSLMLPPGSGVNAPHARINRIDHDIGGELLQTNFHVRLQRLYRIIDRLLNICIDLLEGQLEEGV